MNTTGRFFRRSRRRDGRRRATPAECVEDLNRLVRAGAKAITLRITGWNQREQFDRIVAEVLPHVGLASVVRRPLSAITGAILR